MQNTAFDEALQDFVQHVGMIKQKMAVKAQTQRAAMPPPGAPGPQPGAPGAPMQPMGSAPAPQGAPMPMPGQPPAPAYGGAPPAAVNLSGAPAVAGDLRNGTTNMLRVMMEGRLHANLLAAMLQKNDAGGSVE